MIASVIGRVAVGVCALALAGAVVVSAEQSNATPGPIGRLLGVGATLAQVSTAATKVASATGKPSAADLAAASRLATTAPLSPLPYLVFAASRDDDALIDRALKRDPRFALGYSWRLLDRGKAGDVTGITRALVGLAATVPNDRVLQGLVQVSADPRARAIIKEKLRGGAPWRDSFLVILGASSADRNGAFDLLQAADRTPAANAAASTAPNDRRNFLAQLTQKQDYERAYLAWVQWLPAASQAAVGNVFDGGFRAFDALPPFGWQIMPVQGGSVTIEPTRGLSLDYAGTEGVTLVQQTLMLPPGRYRLKTVANLQAPGGGPGSDGSASGPPITWSLVCLPTNTPLQSVPLPLAGRTASVQGPVFAVNGQCVAQRLDLAVAPMDFSRHFSGSVRSVEIEAIR